MKPTLYFIAAFLVFLAFTWSIAAVQQTPISEGQRASVPLTKSMYEGLQIGISVEQAFEIIGCQPTEDRSATSTITGRKVRVLHWQNSNKRLINATFHDGKLVEKSSSVLPD